MELFSKLASSRFTHFLLLSILISACDSGSEQSTEEDTGQMLVEQGWEQTLSEEFQHTSFGSKLIPLVWYQHLRTPSGSNIFSSDVTAEIGLIEGKLSTNNKLGLPVGVTIDNDDNGQSWIGLGCAACHTGEVKYNNQSILLNGGQGMVNFTRLEETIIQALEFTLNNEQEFVHFVELSGSSGYSDKGDKLKAQMRERLQYLKYRHQINSSETEYGYGRLDAFGQIFNTVGVELLGIEKNRISPDAPVSYPVLWDASHFDLVQWNASAPNANPGPLVQNITTAIAVYGQMEVLKDHKILGYKSSVNIENLKKIENWLYQLKAPKWPQQLLGKLDEKLLLQGKKVYQSECIQCHAQVAEDKSKYKIKVTTTPVDQVGTDPRMAHNFLNTQMWSGVFEGKRLLWLAGHKIEKKDKAINLVAHAAVGAALHHPLQTVDAALEDYHSVYKSSIDKAPYYYKARPLTGIWSSAPYLHNGSVLTLTELLSPVEERRKDFYVGDRTLDLERIGLISSKGKNRSYFDTRLPGNSNQGHLYGVHLSKQEKQALLEYLKSL
ncbi:di-heme-cytochrome C peroxidase [Aliikangiella sp. G2MR2-5]|uniref:di-heme-cytochrome C peroxidase n=1 Tax=Aliikangiella sp. G2MR2-5 TaxID=2788943 RepID=UPI0018A96B14|nr:di-heme-cytochrome C peroxidase [Aliikangiella sp. G2MR2-5]